MGIGGTKRVAPVRGNGSDELLAKQAAQAGFFLRFQFNYEIGNPAALFLDSQSLLFLGAVHFLLPALDHAGMAADRKSLIAALWVHCLLWDADLAHMLFLKSSLFSYLGMKDYEADSLVQSFRLTDPEDHDYVSKAQAAWMCLLDDDQVVKAKQFMLDVYRTCPQDARTEVREILDETYA